MKAGSAASANEAARFVEAHNRERARVGSPPLVWSASLARSAAAWARTLVEHDEFRPQRTGTVGENLFEVVGDVATPEAVVTAWASEIRNFDRVRGVCRGGRCGHYTQVVWGDTREVGCGSAKSGNRQVWACYYNPPGNVLGERPYPLK